MRNLINYKLLNITPKEAYSRALVFVYKFTPKILIHYLMVKTWGFESFSCPYLTLRSKTCFYSWVTWPIFYANWWIFRISLTRGQILLFLSFTTWPSYSCPRAKLEEKSVLQSPVYKAANGELLDRQNRETSDGHSTYTCAASGFSRPVLAPRRA